MQPCTKYVTNTSELPILNLQRTVDDLSPQAGQDHESIVDFTVYLIEEDIGDRN